MSHFSEWKLHSCAFTASWGITSLLQEAMFSPCLPGELRWQHTTSPAGCPEHSVRPQWPIGKLSHLAEPVLLLHYMRDPRLMGRQAKRQSLSLFCCHVEQMLQNHEQLSHALPTALTQPSQEMEEHILSIFHTLCSCPISVLLFTKLISKRTDLFLPHEESNPYLLL